MDRDQVKYVPVEAGEFDTEAWVGGERVGYVWCERDGDALLLADITVCQGCRGRGIGTTLLRRVLRAADSAGVRRTWGSVTADDLRRWPGLLDWYGCHGFAVEEPDAECVPEAVKKVIRRG